MYTGGPRIFHRPNPDADTFYKMCMCMILLSFVGNLPSYQMKSERHHNIFVKDTVPLG